MRQLLIIAGLVLAVQAKPLTSDVTTEAPLLTPEQIQQDTLIGWSSPQPGPDQKPTPEAPVTSESTVSSLSSDNPDHEALVQQTRWFPRSAAPTSGTAAVASIPSQFSKAVIQQHKDMDWSLPLPGPGAQPTREAPIASSEPPATTVIPASYEPAKVPSIPSLFSAELIQQHKEMGWSLPQPGPWSRLKLEAPITTKPTDPSLMANPDPASLVLEQTRWLPRSAQREVRAAPRPLPAHKTHGPRAVLPHGLYPQRKIRV